MSRKVAESDRKLVIIIEYYEKEKIIKDLLDAYVNMNIFEKRIPFAGLCDW